MTAPGRRRENDAYLIALLWAQAERVKIVLLSLLTL